MADPVITWLSTINLFPYIKGLLIVFLLFYLIVAIMVIKQINLMTTTVRSQYNNLLYILAFINLIIVVTVLTASMLFL